MMPVITSNTDIWHENNIIPNLHQTIRYMDYNGIIHRGIFCIEGEQWIVQDIIGNVKTFWADVSLWRL